MADDQRSAGVEVSVPSALMYITVGIFGMFAAAKLADSLGIKERAAKKREREQELVTNVVDIV